MASRQGDSGVLDAPGFGAGPELVPEHASRTEQRTASSDTDSPARRRTPEDPPLRDPSRYAQTDHFRERLHQQGRYVSLPVVSEAIQFGQLRWNTTDGWRFALVRDGVRFVVVVGDTETGSPVVVTGWTEIKDWEAALAADRWTPTDVHTIQLRSDLSDHHEEQIPTLIRPREVSRPFEIGNHRVVSEAGAGFVECVDCHSRFRSKAALTTRRCCGRDH